MQISNLVCMTRFWNNLHRVCSKPRLESQIIQNYSKAIDIQHFPFLLKDKNCGLTFRKKMEECVHGTCMSELHAKHLT